MALSPPLILMKDPRNETRTRRANVRILEQHHWIHEGTGGGKPGTEEPTLRHPIFLEDLHEDTATNTRGAPKQEESNMESKQRDNPSHPERDPGCRVCLPASITHHCKEPMATRCSNVAFWKRYFLQCHQRWKLWKPMKTIIEQIESMYVSITIEKNVNGK